MCNAQYITQLEYELLKDKPGMNVVGPKHLIFFDPNMFNGRNILLSVRELSVIERSDLKEIKKKLEDME